MGKSNFPKAPWRQDVDDSHWEAYADTGWSGTIPVGDSEGNVVAFAVDSTSDNCCRETWGSNARLIKQAPAMFEVLEGILSLVSDSHGVARYHLSGDVEEWAAVPEIDKAAEIVKFIRGEPDG